MLTPGNPVPALKIETVAHGRFDLDADKGENGTLVIQYRGLHCPICIRQMGEVEAALDDFAALGLEVIMLSTDTAERAAETVRGHVSIQGEKFNDLMASYHSAEGMVPAG